MTEYPRAYGEGMLLAFSGIDGPTDYEKELLATTVNPAQGPGLMLHLHDVLSLLAETALNWSEYRVEAALNDVMVFTAGGVKIAFLAAASDTIAGCSGDPFGMDLFAARCEPGFKVICNGDNLVHFANGKNHYALARRRQDGRIFFAFSYAGSGEEAASKAQAAASLDIDLLIDRRLQSYSKWVRPELPQAVGDAYVKAVSILKSSIHSPNQLSPHYWVTPDRVPHKMMWIWDTVFQLSGIMRLWPEKAPDLIRSVFSYQQEDGFIPHMMSPEYLGPHTQPPILGWGAWMAYDATGDKDFLRDAYERNRRFLAWIRANRTNDGGMLGFYINVRQPWCRCGESGLDNSPRFDHHSRLDCVDLCCYVKNEIDIMRRIEEELALPFDAGLAGYGAELERFVRESLWDPERRMFYDRDPSTGRFTGIDSFTSFHPLWAGIATREQASSVMEHLLDPEKFWTGMPLPSVAMNHPSFNRDYWRGCVWLNTGQLLYSGLRRYGFDDAASHLARRSVEGVAAWHGRTGCIFECYDPDAEGDPRNISIRAKELNGGWYRTSDLFGPIRNYGWSASAYIVFVDELYGSGER